MKSFDELYKEYEKEVDKYSSGLIKAEKAEFMKIVLAFQILRGNEEAELKKRTRCDLGKSHS